MYHRVNDNCPKDRLCVKSIEFKKQMEFLAKNHYEVLTLEDVYNQLKDGRRFNRDRTQVVITFDDGFEDNYINAFPILKKYGFSATVFLTVSAIGKLDFLNWNQIQQMSQNNITFGAHTLNHYELTGVPIKQAEIEINSSKEIIESKGLRCDFFCYPKGDFNQKIKGLVRNAGFKLACCIKPGANFSGQDLFELKRTEISGFDSIFDFGKKLAGAFDWMHRLIQSRQAKLPPVTHRPLKVLYLIWSLGLGGAEQVVINLAKGLDRERFYPIVCCLNEKGEFADELEQRGIDVIALHKKGKFDISIIKKIISVINRYKIDIVHTHLWGANFWGVIAARLAGVKNIVTTIHNVNFADNKLEEFLERFVARLDRRIVAVGEEIRKVYAEKTDMHRNKIKVIYNGISAEYNDISLRQLTGLKEELGIANGEKVISIIGRLVPQKGHRYLFEALNFLNGQHKIKLLVVGEGPLRDSLQSIVHTQQLEDKVVFTGLRRDIAQILDVSDAVVLPSLYEGVPIVILEAMARKKPVIATDVGGNKELIGSFGILVPAADSKALAEAIERLIQNSQLCRQIGESAYQHVKCNFSAQKMVQETEKVYLDLIG